MRLYIDTMDAILADVDAEGRVRFENEDWSMPTLQERRAILHAARRELESLRELMGALDRE